MRLDGGAFDPQVLESMTHSVSHRGPDGYGFAAISSLTGATLQIHDRPVQNYSDILTREPFDIGFGHRRLAILDLSEAGNQPMKNGAGDLWITYNGEIYNYLELRNELKQKGRRFASSSDTETILYAYQEWGESCLEKFCGMFAFALWDQKQRKLFCARDRFGMKPFYFFYDRNVFLFASEIKQFFRFPSFRKEPNDPMVYDYLAHGFMDHSEQTLYKGVRQLEPGNFLTIQTNGSASGIHIEPYWRLDCDSLPDPSASKSRFPDIFFDLFSRSVRQHLRSDVSVGSCLSGGIDSSSVVCVANTILRETRASPGQQTFSAAFEDKGFDEREFSNAVVEFAGVDNRVVFPDMNKILEELPAVMNFHDEPFGSTSQYSQWKLFEKIQRSGIKVVLDGQGADEILGGYHSCYGGRHLQLIKERRWTSLFREIRECRVHHQYKVTSILRLMASVLAIRSLGPRLAFLRRPAWMKKDFFLRARQDLDGPAPRFSENILTDFLVHLLQFNLRALLKYEDRSSMAHSVEARMPFLDHRLVEFLFAVPGEQRIHLGWTKAIMRNALKNRVPEKVLWRKDKMGFVTPEKKWISSLPMNVLDEALSSRAVKDSGYLNPDEARKEFLSIARGQKPFKFLAWRILNFCVWLDRLKASS
ncbi:MAG: asparagine synthase (glutamine-hydrolyzing) [Nitrospinae bacterium]|nr:asparagine synthase (glutamine-hydrolyzing) [Nitrospinota bacterium]